MMRDLPGWQPAAPGMGLSPAGAQAVAVAPRRMDDLEAGLGPVHAQITAFADGGRRGGLLVVLAEHAHHGRRARATALPGSGRVRAACETPAALPILVWFSSHLRVLAVR